MTAPRFLTTTAALGADRVRLDGPEGRHAARARRLQPGEPVELSDGAGQLGAGVVAAVGPDWIEVDVVRRQAAPPSEPRLVVAQALAKGDRALLAVAALTEVGVDEIVPWAAERCVVRWAAGRALRGLDRWRVTAREAAKQSRRDRVPPVTGLVGTAELAERVRTADAAYLLHESAGQPLAGRPVPQRGGLLLVIGPEGGLTDAELATLGTAGAVAVRLGPTVLRTSTAGAVAAAVVLAGTQRWRAGGSVGQ